MIIREREVEVVGNLGGKKVEMFFKAESMNHIMGILSKMYSDPIAAVVRELTTNGADSHKAAGIDDPVEVFSPTTMNPTFRVVDHGIGMSTEDVETIFLGYGESTKLNTNDQTGGFGIGSKSPLGYGAQTYHVTAVKNGVKTSVVVGRDTDSAAAGELFVSETDLPDGVTITVPVNNRDDHWRFKSAAEYFQKYSRFPVKVDGEMPEPWGQQIGDRFVVERSSFGTDLLVMGDVTYPIKFRDGHRLLRNDRVVIYADMGDFTPAPTREEIVYTDQTHEMLDRYVDEFFVEYSKSAQDYIDQAPARSNALARRATFVSNISREDHRKKVFLTYKGEEVPEEFGLSAALRHMTIDDDRVTEVEIIQKDIPLTPMNVQKGAVGRKTLMIVDYPHGRFTRVHGQKTLEYIKKAGDHLSRNFLWIASQHDENFAHWFDDNIEFVSWDKISSIKVNLPSKEKGTKKKVFPMFDHAMGHYKEALPDDSKPIYYVSQSDLDKLGIYRNGVSRWAEEGDQIVYTYGIAKRQLLKQHPTAVPIFTLIKIRAKEFLTGLSESDRLLYASRYNSAPIPYRLRDQIEDPELQQLIVDTNGQAAIMTKMRQFNDKVWRYLEYEVRKELGELHPDIAEHDMSEKLEALYERYPLLNGSRYYSSAADEHLVMYCNMVYQGLQTQ